jgi:hypothetical protein
LSEKILSTNEPLLLERRSGFFVTNEVMGKFGRHAKPLAINFEMRLATKSSASIDISQKK